jgi:hypothetical protein
MMIKPALQASLKRLKLDGRMSGKPIMLRWTREEEFSWAYFRPAAVIDVEASLDEQNRLATWYHLNINSGGNSIDSSGNMSNHFLGTLKGRCGLTRPTARKNGRSCGSLSFFKP